MRIGQNPAKFVDTVAQPTEITVTVVSCIPFLSGYYEQSKDVLKACLYSLHQNTDQPFDLMVFDNHSCPEVQQFLIEAYQQNIIQYLVLSDKNIGKIGAWNYMFGAAQGEFIAFADSDIFFRPGWLSASLALFDAFPNVGMVTGRPLRTPDQFSEATLSWGRNQGKDVYEEGAFLKWEVFVEHTDSIGVSREDAQQQYKTGMEHRFSYHNQIAFSGAAHFQFLTRKTVLSKVMPLPSEKPMRGERGFDIAVDKLGYLRLCTEQAYVLHMGNRVPPGEDIHPPVRRHYAILSTLAHLPGIRHALLWLYNQIFRLYFHKSE
jgi:glycosyltransferase involved in cell wall biosynthesis